MMWKKQKNLLRAIKGVINRTELDIEKRDTDFIRRIERLEGKVRLIIILENKNLIIRKGILKKKE